MKAIIRFLCFLLLAVGLAIPYTANAAENSEPALVTMKAAIPEFFNSPVSITYKNSDKTYTFTLTLDNGYTSELRVEPGEYTISEAQTDNNYRIRCFEKITEQAGTIQVYVQPNEPIEDGMIKVCGTLSVPVGYKDDVICVYTSDTGSFRLTYTESNGYSDTAVVLRDDYTLSEYTTSDGFTMGTHSLDLTEEQSPYIYKESLIAPKANEFNISVNGAVDGDVFVTYVGDTENTVRLSKNNDYKATITGIFESIKLTDVQCPDGNVSFDYLQNEEATGDITITATKQAELPSEENPTEGVVDNMFPIILMGIIAALIIIVTIMTVKHQKTDKPKKTKPVKTRVAKDKKEKKEKKGKQTEELKPIQQEPKKQEQKPSYLVAPTEKEKTDYNPEIHDFTKLEVIPEEEPAKTDEPVATQPPVQEEPQPEKIDFGEIKDVTGMEIEDDDESFEIDPEALYATSKYKDMFDSNVVRMTQTDDDDGDGEILEIPAESETVDIEEINV